MKAVPLFQKFFLRSERLASTTTRSALSNAGALTVLDGLQAFILALASGEILRIVSHSFPP